MSSRKQNLSGHDLTKLPSAEGHKIHIVVSDWNKDITATLLDGAKKTLIECGGKEDDIFVLNVPGTFELPIGARTVLKSKSSDAVICLGCVIKGETDHDKYINQSVAITLNQLAITSGKPIVFGVLTVNSMEQALDRAGGQHGNKGVEAAVTAIKMVQLQKDINKPESTIGF